MLFIFSLKGCCSLGVFLWMIFAALAHRVYSLQIFRLTFLRTYSSFQILFGRLRVLHTSSYDDSVHAAGESCDISCSKVGRPGSEIFI